MTDTAVSAFESIKHTAEDGREYWSARELGKLLGYDKWQNFLSVIHEAIEVCRVHGGSTDEVFTAISKNPTKRGGRPSAEYDYHLSRHACYIVAESADGRKPQVALAKLYFALTTERYELLAATEEERLRIEARQKLLRHNAELALAAREAGVMSKREFADFFNSGYLGLYRETKAEIALRKGLKPTADISDHMGSLETSANDFRAALARQMMADRGVIDRGAANATHYEAADSVRGLLLAKGIRPEQLPTPAKSYQQLLREEEARQQILAEDALGLWALLPDTDTPDSQ